MIEVEVNGIIHEFPEGTSPEVMRSALQKRYPLPQQEIAPQTSIPATLQNIGSRFARNTIAGLGGVADVAMLPVKTALAGSMLKAESMGADTEKGLFGMLGNVAQSPSMRDASLALYDEATDSKFKPNDIVSKGVDFVNELAVPSNFMAKLSNITKEKTAFDAYKTLDSGVINAIRQVAPENPDEALSQIIKAKSQGLYSKAQQVGGGVKPEVTNNALRKIMEDVKPKTRAGELIKGSEDEVSKLLDRLNYLRGQSLSLEEVQDIDTVLGDVLSSPNFTDSLTGKLTDQGRSVLKIQDAFRDVIDNASIDDVIGGKEGFDALKEARTLWSRSLKARDIERIVEKSVNKAQPAQSMKSGFDTLLNNPKRIKGFTEQEKELIKKAAQTNVIKDALRVPASRLVSAVGLGSTGNPVIGAGLEGLGMLSRNAGEGYQLNQASKILEEIAKNAGMLPVKTPPVSPLRTQAAGIGAYGLGMLGAQQ